ncbi:alpha/beta fold hydrolase [Rhodococcus sp. ABRD24]|uniref:alpha/beta hydrolase family protein n=1 Tax=Rhodococcus sp. ABRD24 TaxID=2507582 RepID=UPI00103F8941|nr:alpha/beta fold hydrolase [Rhodococcus sp. ABRD24]QBJ96597.1 alpha/beta fold hydrolase [Rhodococcus sp. ABRD24]
MAELSVCGNELVLTLTRMEKIAGVHGDVTVPLAQVRDVDVVADAFANIGGTRAPGLAVPRRIRIGTCRGGGARTFVVARGRLPAVRVRTVGRAAGAEFDQLIVSSADALVVAGRIRDAVEDGRPGVTEREVAFRSGDGTLLAGTLTVPDGGQPGPVALILTGSGQVDRDGDHPQLSIGISRALANALARNGVASLRYDKRGVGRSGGNFCSAGFADNLEDAASAIEWLRTTAGFARSAIAVIGHSEGACHAIALGADRGVGIAAVVLLAGPAATGEATLMWQSGQVMAGLSAPVRMLVRVLRIDVAARQRNALRRLRASSGDVAWMGPRRINARWFREFLDFDPKPLLQQIHSPVIAITGAKDIQVDPNDLEVVAALVPGPVDTVRMPDLTHLMRRDPGTPSLGAYRRLVREPVDPEVLELVSDWTAGHLRRV